MKSSVVWTAIFALIVIGMLAYGIVRVRRTRETQRARSNERAAAMLLAMHQESARPRSTSAVSTGSSAAAPVRNTLQRKARLLDDHQRLLYLVLRTALSDHVIMGHVRVGDLVDTEALPAYGEHETRLRQLLQERIDCVVCSNDLAPLAAIMVYDATSGVAEERIKTEALRELGVRFLRFRADSLPKPAQMRSLVLE